MSKKPKVISAKIEINSGPLVPAWVLFALYSVICTAAVWLATAWMLTGVAVALTIIGAAIAGYSPWRFSSLPAFLGLGLTALYFVAPAGQVLTWRSYLLVALVTAAFRLFAMLSLVSRRTEIAVAVLWRQTRIWAVLVAIGFVILLVLQLGTQGSVPNQAWMYLVAGALILVAVLSALSLKDSKRS